MRVLVTGSTGWTAQAIVLALVDAGHTVYGFDLPDAEYLPEARAVLRAATRSTIADQEAVDTAVRGVAAIVHLAVAVGSETYNDPRVPFATNVCGTYNVFAAARRHGVGRVVLLSEAAVHFMPPDGQQIDARHGWRSSPDGDHLYDLTKRLQEQIAQDFCATYGMTAFVLRAGHIVDSRAQVDPAGRSLDTLTYCRGGWVCRYDIAAACVRALVVDATGYQAFHVIGSVAARERFDIERTERELGVVCAQQFAQYL